MSRPSSFVSGFSRFLCLTLVLSALFIGAAAAAGDRPSGNLDSWLNGHPALKSRMVWVTGDGKKLGFDQWPQPLKKRHTGKNLLRR